MISVEAKRSFDAAEWKALVSSVGGNPFHSPEVLLVSSKPEDLIYLVFKRNGEAVGAAVGLSLEKSLLKFLKVSKMLYLPTVPATLEGVHVDDLFDALIGFAKGSGYKTIEVEPRWGEDFSAHPKLRSFVERRLLEFTIDLRQGDEELLKAMHQKHRKNVRKSTGNGLELAWCDGLDKFLKLRDMQQSSSERSAGKGNDYGIQDEGYYIESYKKVYENGPGKVMFALKDGEIVAALAYLAFGRKAVTVRSGATQKGYETSAMYLLQHELIRLLKEEGFTELNIGGVPADAETPGHQQHGLYNYKKYYGGKPCLRTGLKINL